MSESTRVPPPIGTLISVSFCRTDGSQSHAGYGVYLGPGPVSSGGITSMSMLWKGRVANFEAEPGIWEFTRVTSKS